MYICCAAITRSGCKQKKNYQSTEIGKASWNQLTTSSIILITLTPNQPYSSSSDWTSSRIIYWFHHSVILSISLSSTKLQWIHSKPYTLDWISPGSNGTVSLWPLSCSWGRRASSTLSISSAERPSLSGPATSREHVHPQPAIQFVVSCTTTSAASASQLSDTNSSAMRFAFKISSSPSGADLIRGGTFHNSAIAAVGTVKRPGPTAPSRVSY